MLNLYFIDLKVKLVSGINKQSVMVSIFCILFHSKFRDSILCAELKTTALVLHKAVLPCIIPYIKQVIHMLIYIPYKKPILNPIYKANI